MGRKRKALNHASNFACEYCTSKAVKYKNINSKENQKENLLKIKNLEKQIHDIQNTPGSTAVLKKQDEQIEMLKKLIIEIKQQNVVMSKSSHSVWPYSTRNGSPRTKEEVLSIINLLEENDRSQLTADDIKGIVGKSLLLDIPDFDFINAIPAEYMHLGCLGVVKRLGI